MSHIDYYRVEGIGINLTYEMIQTLIKNKIFSNTEWEDDPEECLKRLKINYAVAGNFSLGDTHYYLFIDGIELPNISNNATKFVNKLINFGIEINDIDIQVIFDTCICKKG